MCIVSKDHSGKFKGDKKFIKSPIQHNLLNSIRHLSGVGFYGHEIKKTAFWL